MVMQLSADMQQCRAGFEEEVSYRSYGGKMATNYSMGHQQQRSCWAEAERGAYRNVSKARMMRAVTEELPCAKPSHAAAAESLSKAKSHSATMASPPSPTKGGMFASLRRSMF